MRSNWLLAVFWPRSFHTQDSCGLLICTLISENHGLEKSRSTSNVRKNFRAANLDFFSRFHPEQCCVYTTNVKKLRFAEPEIFLKPLQKKKGPKNLRYPTKKEEKNCFFVGYLKFIWPFLFWTGFRVWRRPWFSEIRLQIKRLMIRRV